MVVPLLATKLFAPPVRPELVPRWRLIERMEAGLEQAGLDDSGFRQSGLERSSFKKSSGFARKLTLVCAPAGFGKTTLVAEWLRDQDRPYSWLTLDEEDNDPVRFLTYLVAATQRIDSNIGQTARAMLGTPPPPQPEVLLTGLINDIVATPHPFVLVLDDYHVIHSKAIHQQLAFLVEHQPPQMHLVLATREEPPLPLASLRARGQLADIRQADLRFTAEETADLMRRMVSLELSSTDVAALHQRAEGWIAGLQLAALALQGTPSLDGSEHVASFVESFAGSHRYILDYLMDEVFRRQPPDLQAFLLATSILNRFNASLCDAVWSATTGLREKGESRKVLQTLEQANLFLVPLDESRQWYRYHRLFADLLQHRLKIEGRHDVARLHRQASHWYADHGLPEDAVRHALAASDWEAAALLIGGLSDSLMKHGGVVTLLGWYQALPESVILANPRLCVEYSWPLIFSEQIEAAEAYLAQAEQAAHEQETFSLLGSIAMARAYIARVRGDGARVIELSEQALSLLPEDDLSGRSIVAVNLGLAQWYRGNQAAAERALSEAERAGRGSRNDYARWAASIFLGRIETARGRLRRAAESYRQIIQQGGQLPIICLAHYDLGRLHYEWNDLHAAADQVQRGIELACRSGSAEFEVGGCSTLALIKQAQGETSAARAALRRADRLLEAADIPVPTRMVNLASHVAVALLQGDLAAASRAAERFPAGPEGAGSFPDYLNLMWVRARLLLGQGQAEAAREQLAALHAMACQAGWLSTASQARALQALVAPTREEALVCLADVLETAGPEGYVRTFVDSGEPMATLLQEALSRSIEPDYAAQLLTAFEGAPLAEVRMTESLPSVLRPSALLEPLSDREIDVLRLLARGLTYREIAQALFLSINTVKTHVRNIYGKLGVTRRRAATARARELDLLS
jgi:LuxR family maltose regulon positive regulatory protein